MRSEERKEPYNTLNRTNNIVYELSEKWPQKRKRKKRNSLTRRSLIKVVEKTTTESLRTDSLEKEDFGKVPKRSAHNRKQSY